MKQRVISIHYTLTDNTGTTLDTSRGQEPFMFLEGAGQIIPGLERALALLSAGDKRKIDVKASDAYGDRDDTRVVQVERSRIPNPQVKVGDMFQGGDGPEAPVLVVTEVTTTHVTLDGNHPLAGKDLTFDVEVISLREASPQEITHGHAHGAHGHDH